MSNKAEMQHSPTRRGETENATEQKEKTPSPNAIQGLRNEFEQSFKSKTWRGVHKLPKGSSNRRALVVAINYGERRPPHRLYGTFVDAMRVIKMLEGFGYKSDDICVLADIVMPESANGSESDTSESDDSESRLPKRKNILKGLRWLGSDSGAGQYRFLFFSGHGHYQPHKPSPTSNQCIMPEDVKFHRLNSCTDCVCSNNVWRASDREPSLVPEPFSVLWDHVINQRLSSTLESGTKFTALFDCCYSGGMVETAFQNGPGIEIINLTQPNSKGRRQYGVADSVVPIPRVANQISNAAQVLLPSGDVDMSDPSAEQAPQPVEGLNFTKNYQSSELVHSNTSPRHHMAGNFLGLPVEIDLITGGKSRVSWARNADFIQGKHDKTRNLSQATPLILETKPLYSAPQLWPIWARSEASTPAVEEAQPLADFTCQRPGIFSTIAPFADGCEVMCWAACRKIESALEDQKNAGRFTEAFTEFLTRPRSDEETQLPRSTGVLISHLSVKFIDYNKEACEKDWAEQHPKLFISAGLSEDYLQREPDI